MRQVFGAILMAVGLLIGGTGGLCALLLVVTSPSDGFGIVMIPLVIGGAMFAAGLQIHSSDPGNSDRS